MNKFWLKLTLALEPFLVNLAYKILRRLYNKHCIKSLSLKQREPSKACIALQKILINIRDYLINDLDFTPLPIPTCPIKKEK